MKVFSRMHDKHLIENRDRMARLIHNGWAENYVYWRDNKPWLGNKLYNRPKQTLGDERRNNCVITKYADLNQEEKDKDYIFVNFIINSLKKE